MGVAKVQNFTFEYLNTEEFHRLKREIFTRHSYYVEIKAKQPRIIDAGAHIGLATGYFLWLYPDAEITAIEPNPRIVPILKQNVDTNQWWNVMVEEGALGETYGRLPYFFDKSPDQWYSTGGFTQGAWNGRQKSWEIEVKTKPLMAYLHQPVDILKLDIEGAEEKVLQAAGDKLKMIKHILMEYHPVPGNSLERITKLLETHKFTVTVRAKRRDDEGLLLVEAGRG